MKSRYGIRFSVYLLYWLKSTNTDAALHIQLHEAMRKKEEAMHDLHQTREALENKMDGLRRQLYYIFFLYILEMYTLYLMYTTTDARGT